MSAKGAGRSARLEALIEKWRDPEWWKDEGCRMDSQDCANELAAVLAEEAAPQCATACEEHDDCDRPCVRRPDHQGRHACKNHGGQEEAAPLPSPSPAEAERATEYGEETPDDPARLRALTVSRSESAVETRPSPSFPAEAERLRELARQHAKGNHAQDAGHVRPRFHDSTRAERAAAFATCPHKDCVLVRTPDAEVKP